MPLAGFHPTIQRWFAQKFGEPTEPQLRGWPCIQRRCHTLIAAPTGTGKTLTGFLWAINDLLSHGAELPHETRVLYVSPLRALSNDVQKNLQGPLQELHEMDPSLPEVRVSVRTGDTPAHTRAAMLRKPPHILVSTPESLYILLTSEGGRRMLRTIRTVIVDEIHSLARDKRGSHLALSLERLEHLTGPVQRIGLSATQKPLADVARFLVGMGRECECVDVGHRRDMDVAIEVPPSPLSNVCSHEQWDEIYVRIAQLIAEHRTTLIFVNTRKFAERIAARLTDVLGEDKVTCHHSSLSRERRLDAEQRLKAGSLSALVATASLELGIDIGDVDLVIQIGATRSIATFLQRVGRSGHAVRRIPKGRLFPLTIDELVEAAALMRAAARGELDRTPQPAAPLDILAQQIVAECAVAGIEGWSEDALFDLMRRAWPYRDLKREEFEQAVGLHTEGRRGLLHRDGVGRRLMARKRARIAALTGGGAIPDVSDFQVIQHPEGTFIGTLNEDFAVEANGGDIFQLGNTSWRILRVEQGVVRVTDARGQPPSIPFWLGEGPSRTEELSAEIGRLREECQSPEVLQGEIGLSLEAAMQISHYIAEGKNALGCVPTQKRLVLERFFDESGGMQMVLHAPFGGRINRAWGLALRKKFCRGFGYELQAAANEEAIIISLGLRHSFDLEGVFKYLKPEMVRETLTQAVLDQPMFESRWRWNATRSLVLDRCQNGQRVPPAIMRMRAADLLAQSFPAAVACPENLPAGDLPIPMEHPIVRQTIEDCLSEATDVEGLIAVLGDLREGRIEQVAIDTPTPSAFARGVLSAQPYSFLDDAPLEERRTQAVISRHALDLKQLDELGALDPAAVQRVRQEAWPVPENAEEVHEALLWMGYAMDDEAQPWLDWLLDLTRAGRVKHELGRWFAMDGTTDPKRILLGRLEALGPVFEDDTRIAHVAGDNGFNLLQLQGEGAIFRTRLEGRTAWCERRLLARIHRYTVETLRAQIEPATASEFMQFLRCWQHVDEDYRLEGPRGVAESLRQLAGFEAPARVWESGILSRRVRDYRREWLDEVTLSGEFAWGRLWGSGGSAIRVTPITFIPRDDMDQWVSLADPPSIDGLGGPAHDLLDAFRGWGCGAMFAQELAKAAGLIPSHLEMGLADLIARGVVTCDSFAPLRQMITPPSRRKRPVLSAGRWSLLRDDSQAGAQKRGERRDLPQMAQIGTVSSSSNIPSVSSAQSVESRSQRLRNSAVQSSIDLVARQLLRRTGVVFRKTVERERIPITWSALVRAYRLMELRGEVRGGRFVHGFSGEQFGLPEAVDLLRRVRRRANSARIEFDSDDVLSFQHLLTPPLHSAHVAAPLVARG
jgi:ATP-dependent Lhr-like helicase